MKNSGNVPSAVAAPAVTPVAAPVPEHDEGLQQAAAAEREAVREATEDTVTASMKEADNGGGTAASTVAAAGAGIAAATAAAATATATAACSNKSGAPANHSAASLTSRKSSGLGWLFGWSSTGSSVAPEAALAQRPSGDVEQTAGMSEGEVQQQELQQQQPQQQQQPPPEMQR